MTGEIINLRMARKQKQRAEREDQAAKNRFEHGRSKAERQKAEQENKRNLHALDAGRRDNPKKPEDDDETAH